MQKRINNRRDIIESEVFQMGLMEKVAKKVLGRDPEEFVPQVLPDKVLSPEEAMRKVGKRFSLDDAARSVIPVDVPAIVGRVQEEVVELGSSLTPENIVGAKGPIDVPLPPKLSTHIPRRAMADVALPGPMQALDKVTPSGMPKPERVIFAPVNAVKIL